MTKLGCIAAVIAGVAVHISAQKSWSEPAPRSSGRESIGYFTEHYVEGQWRGFKILSLGPFLESTGLKKNDLVLKIQDTSIGSEYDFLQSLSTACRTKKPIVAQVIRDGARCNQIVILPVVDPGHYKQWTSGAGRSGTGR